MLEVRSRRTDSVSAVVRAEWFPVGVVLVLALALRVAAAVAYWPALMWTDSWNYLFGSQSSGGFTADKPGGYANVLRVLRLGSDALWTPTVLQHMAGLASAVLVYALLRRRGVSKLLATGVVAVVALDAYAVALERHLLAEALFTLVLCAFAFVAVASRRSVWLVAIAGVLIAVAASFRAVAVFLVPLWIVYCVWAFPDARRRVVGVAAVVLALVGYSAFHAATIGGFGLTQMGGWSLYSRVAEIGSCEGRDVPAGQRPLCPDPSPDLSEWSDDSVAFHQFAPESPIQRVYGDLFGLSADQRVAANAELSAFARQVVRDRPLRFAGLLASETLRFLTPGADSRLAAFDDPVTFPDRVRPVVEASRSAQRAYAPGYVSPADPPASALASYREWVHMPRWLLAVALVLSLASLLAPAVRRGRGLRLRAETFLLAGCGGALLVGGALNHYEPRYAVPAVPLLLAAGALAITDLARSRQGAPR
jgi:hypothetical protein